MKKFLLSILCCMLAMFSTKAEETANLSFANKAQRISFSSTEQVWEQNGIKFTNSKSASTTNVADYANPVRLYANSKIVVECTIGNITKIVFDCNSSSYANTLKNSIGDNATVSSDKVTIATDGSSNTFTIAKLTAQVRMEALTVTYTSGGGEIVEKVNTPVITPSGGVITAEEKISIACATEGATIMYSINDSEEMEYSEPFTLEEDATVTAYAHCEGMEASNVATADFTVIKATSGCYYKVTTTPADWSGKYLIVYESQNNAYVFNAADAVNGYVAATTDGKKIQANSIIDAEVVTIETTSSGYAINSKNGYIYGDSGSNKLSFNKTTAQINTIEFDNDGSIKITSGRVLRFNNASNQMRFRYYSEGTQKPVYLYKYYEEGTVHTLDISEIGYATLFLGFNAEIPANVEAYIATSTENDRVQLTQVEGVLPAETGVIVKATAGSYDFFRSEEETTDVTGNLFKGSAESTVISKEANKSYYILANGNNGIGFYKPVNGDDTTQFTNGANKAYLEVEGADRSASFYGFNFDGTTAIEGVEVENVEKVIYDLTGRRVKEIAAPGIYIVNGKKVLVK